MKTPFKMSPCVSLLFTINEKIADLSFEYVSYLKYVQSMSCDVERTFSKFKIKFYNLLMLLFIVKIHR